MTCQHQWATKRFSGTSVKVCERCGTRASHELPTAADDQEWDRQAEALQIAAFGPGSGINPDATDITNVFLSDVQPDSVDALDFYLSEVSRWVGAVAVDSSQSGIAVHELQNLVRRLMPSGGEDAERCESGDAECGPVTHWDSDGVPLCDACWEGLAVDSAGAGCEAGENSA